MTFTQKITYKVSCPQEATQNRGIPTGLSPLKNRSQLLGKAQTWSKEIGSTGSKPWSQQGTTRNMFGTTQRLNNREF